MDRLKYAVLDWADSIAPDREAKDAVVKMVSETSELLDAVLNNGDVEGELGDCIILLIDIADMYGVNLVDAGMKKMAVNRERKWINEGGVIRRIRGEGNGTDRQAADGAAVPDLLHQP